jgi:alpha-glucosidase
MMDDYSVAFPKGAWFDFWTGEKMPPSAPAAPPITETVTAKPGTKFPEPRRIHPKLDLMPVYVRGGSILPIQPLIQNTEETPRGPLELRVFPGTDCQGTIYLDDGHTFDYQRGQFLRQNFTCEADAKSLHLKFHSREGSYTPWWKFVEVVVYDWPSARAEAKITGSAYPLKTTYDPKQKALHITLADQSGESELSVRGRSAP